MKILIFHSDSIAQLPSGENIVVKNESLSIRSLGSDVKLVCYPRSKVHIPSRIILNTFSIFSNIWSYGASEFVRSCIEEYRPNIVHFHGLFPFLSPSALAAAHETGVAVVQTLHNGRWLCLEGGFYRSGRYCDDCVSAGGWTGVRHGCKHGIAASLLLHTGNLSGLAAGRLFRWVDRFIAVSDFIRDQHVRAGFPPEKIVVKNNGMDVDRLRNVCRPELRAGVAYVGRVSRAKGADVLMTLMDAIQEPIHVVGDGPELAELKKYCVNRAYRHVRFWGKQPQAQCFEIMASVCCTVVPSQCGEAFSLTAAESMGLGTPVVGSDVGGLGSLLRSSRGGLVVDARDFPGFIAAVRHLLDHPDKAEALGATGMRYVEQNLGLERNAAELMAIYESVLKDKKHLADHV